MYFTNFAISLLLSHCPFMLRMYLWGLKASEVSGTRDMIYCGEAQAVSHSGVVNRALEDIGLAGPINAWESYMVRYQEVEAMMGLNSVMGYSKSFVSVEDNAQK